MEIPAMINIVTSVCVDTEIEDGTIDYPMLRQKGQRQRRETYWKCATVLMATVSRCCPNSRRVLFTNDFDDIIVNGVNVKIFLQEIGVEVRYLGFNSFKVPNGLSSRFKNAFYKHEVVKSLGQSQEGYSILLDSDCLLIKPENHILSLINVDKVLLYDVYKRKDPFLKEPHNLSMASMGKLFTKIDPHYSTRYPIWFGSEIIGGNQQNLDFVSSKLEQAFINIVEISKQRLLVFENSLSIFDNDEFLCSFVYNDGEIVWQEAGEILKRVWTTEKTNNISKSDTELSIWHLPAEKELGIQKIFCELTAAKSEFWHVPMKDFNRYIGGFVGISQKKLRSESSGKKSSLFKNIQQLLSMDH